MGGVLFHSFLDHQLAKQKKVKKIPKLDGERDFFSFCFVHGVISIIFRESINVKGSLRLVVKSGEYTLS